jgi:hypothetical protein
MILNMIYKEKNMALSKFTTILLWSIVALNSSVLAQGTKAGTEVTVEPMIEYIIEGEKVKEQVAKSKYVVDKIIQFKVTRVLEAKQTTVKGLTFIAPFKVVNSGNSIENFVLNMSYGDIKNFTFNKSVIYLDKNNNGKLEVSEEIGSSVVKNLHPDKEQLVWLSATTPNNIALNQRVGFGLQAKASRGEKNGIYLKSSRKNNILREDIVFGDESSENDKFFNNSYINRYLWTVEDNIDLGVKLETNIMSADPLNGIAKSKKEAELGKFFSIPGATHIRSWKIYNNSLITVKDLHFSINAESKAEKFAKNSKSTWWKRESRIHILLSSKNKIVGEGKYNSQKNSIDFTIKELRGGDVVFPHVVTLLQ